MRANATNSARALTALFISALTLSAFGCGGSNDSPTGPHFGSVSGIVFSSLGGGVASAHVVVTPSGGSALPMATTAANGSYGVSSVVAGSGSVSVSSLPSNCTAPSAGSYSVTAGAVATVNFNVTCTATPTTSTTTLAVGEAAIFADSAMLTTKLVMQANAEFLLTVVNTDSTSAARQDFQIGGTVVASASVVAPSVSTMMRVQRPPVSQASFVRSQQPTMSAGPSPNSAELARMMRLLNRSARNHAAMLEGNREIVARLGNPIPALRDFHAQRARAGGVATNAVSPLVGSTVGAVNKVYVKSSLNGSCSQVDSIGARTVYVGTHVLVLADTNRITWPSAYRPDSAFYAHFGQEYDTLTYAKHLLTYVGDPLSLDAQLSGVGKVTVVFTPVLNSIGGGLLAFVNGCDFYAKTSVPVSNVTEVMYMLTPSASGWAVPEWKALVRPTAAHESKHIVSFAAHLPGGALEYSWLEEGLAQVSSEIWGRNYNLAKWRSNAGFNQTLACEDEWLDPLSCSSSGSAMTFTVSHLPFMYSFLQSTDSTTITTPESFSGTTEGSYGAGWSYARWAIDDYTTGTTPAAEGAFIKSLIQNTGHKGLDNVSNIATAPAPQMLVWWSLASALSSLTDSTAFRALDKRGTNPSFELHGIFGEMHGEYAAAFSLAQPLRLYAMNAAGFQYSVTGIPGTGKVYFSLQNGVSAGALQIKMYSGSGAAISPSSGFRIGIMRVQ